MSEVLAVRAISITKKYGTLTAIDGISMDVAQGEVYGVLGPNGAGKTTFLRMLFGLIRPDAGTLEVLGRAWSTDGVRTLDGVAGFIESPKFYPYLSGRTNLDLLGRLDGLAVRATIDEVLDIVDLASRADDKVGGYSFGMRQRLGVAASLLRSPRLLVLDEPANGLDPAGIRDMRSLVKRLARSGLTVLLSSHDMGEVEEICDNVTVMRAGMVMYHGTIATLREQAPDPSHRLRTSNIARAVALAHDHPRIVVTEATDDMEVRGAQDDVDAYIAHLVTNGVAVRGLTVDETPLEELFFMLTEPGADAPAGRPDRDVAGSAPVTTTTTPVATEVPSTLTVLAATGPSTLAVLGAELRKLAAQHRARYTLLGSLIAPVIITVVLKGQQRPPKDTLFGRHIHSSGFGLALFVLSFVTQWVLPFLTAIVAGDIFASEDHHGTWKTLLTRSVSRTQVFAAKCLAACLFAISVLVVLAASTIASATVLVGRQHLVGLTGQLIPSTSAFALVSASWATALPPLIAFTAIAVLLSILTRNPAIGVVGPIIIGLASQMIGWLGGMDAARRLLPTTPFDAWHGLLAQHRYYDLITQGALVSAGWILVCLGAAYLAFRRRDITGG